MLFVVPMPRFPFACFIHRLAAPFARVVAGRRLPHYVGWITRDWMIIPFGFAHDVTTLFVNTPRVDFAAPLAGFAISTEVPTVLVNVYDLPPFVPWPARNLVTTNAARGLRPAATGIAVSLRTIRMWDRKPAKTTSAVLPLVPRTGRYNLTVIALYEARLSVCRLPNVLSTETAYQILPDDQRRPRFWP